MRTRKGFTIVELVVVIAVIAILAAVLIPTFSGVVEKTDRNTALKLAEAAYKEARAQAIDEYNKNPHDANYQLPRAVEVNGLTFVITADGTDDEIYNYGTFEYQIFINNKKLTLGDKLQGVNNPADDYQNTTAAESVSLFRNELTLAVGQSEMLFAAVTPAYAKGYTIEWSSASDKVSVNNGMIKGESVTDTSVTVTATLIVNGETKNTAECKVTVVPVAVNYVTLDSLNIEVELGKTHPLTATVKPDGAVYDGIAWESSDNSIATVDSTGKVTAVGFGHAIITAQAGGKPASCGVIVNGIKLLNNPDTMTVGSKHVLAYETFPAGMSVTWTSDNTDVAKVDEAGVVTALKESAEPVTITATTSGGHHAEYRIDSITALPEIEAVGVEFTTTGSTGSSAVVTKGNTIDLVPTNLPAGLTISWSSSAEEVAKVENGVVTPVGGGTATITAKTTINNNEYSATCQVTVPYTVTKDATNATIEGAETVIPGGAYTATITPDSGYVVDSVTVIMGVENVTATTYTAETHTINISSVTGDIKIIVTVVDDMSNNFTLDTDEVTLGIGGQLQINAIVTNGFNSENIVWSSSDMDVATVSSGLVTAKAKGTTTITAKIKDTSVTATCVVTVVESIVEVESVTLQTSTWETTKGQNITLVATINPTNATNKTVSWSSSDENVATVDDTGEVIAISGGTATITATVGGKSATCLVTVKEEYNVIVTVDKNAVDYEGDLTGTIIKGNLYTAKVTPKSGCEITGVTVKMGGNDITEKAYTQDANEIAIPDVSGDIEIDIVTSGNPIEPASFSGSHNFETNDNCKITDFMAIDLAAARCIYVTSDKYIDNVSFYVCDSNNDAIEDDQVKILVDQNSVMIILNELPPVDAYFCLMIEHNGEQEAQDAIYTITVE